MSFSLASLGIGITRLYGPHGLPTGSATLLYTVPSSGVSACIITQIQVVNSRTDSSVSTWSLYVVPNGGTLSTTENAVVANRPLSPGDLPDIIKGPIALAPGDMIYGFAAAGAQDCIISGTLLP